MNKPLVAACLSVLIVAGCGTVRESRLNPFNWFGSSQRETTIEPKDGYSTFVDQRGLVDQIVSMNIDSVPGGAIIRAVGLPPTQGYWSAELVSTTDEKPEDGTLTYEFRIEEPIGFERTGTQPSREVVVAHFVSNAKLRNVRQIRILGATDARVSRR